MLRTCYKAALTAAAFFVGMNAAMAASPVGQWNAKFYIEPNLAKGATQGVCYEPDGTWFSTTFAGWHGGWFQDGDRFRWYGTTGTVGTAEFGQVSSAPSTRPVRRPTSTPSPASRMASATGSPRRWAARASRRRPPPPAAAAIRPSPEG